jgi:hypothetical protein
MRSLPGLLPLLFLPGLLAACADGGGGTQESALTSIDVLLTDAAAKDLLFLRAEIDSLVIEHSDGTLTPNLLEAPLTVDLQGLDGTFQWLFTGEIGNEAISAVHIGFDAAEFSAAAKDGTPVAVTALLGVLQAQLPPSLFADHPESYVRLEVDVDLVDSLEGLVSSGTLTMTPVGATFSSAGSAPVALDAVKGSVVSSDALLGTVEVAAFADGDLLVPLGTATVLVSPSTLLVDEDGSVFASEAAFFATLIPGTTLLEVDGELDDGVVTATRVVVEDALGLGGLVAELRGKVIGHAPGTSFELLLQEVEQGAAAVLPVLSDLGDPASLTIGIDPGTVFFVEDAASVESALAVGQEVEVELTQFATAPFPAFKVEIAHAEPLLEGFIADLSGLPATFAIHLQDGEPALLAGLVASSGTDVTVTVGSAGLSLKVDGAPSLATSDLSVDLRVRVRGVLSGTPSAPALDPSAIEVLPGRLEGALVASTTPGSSLFMTTGGTLVDPFGGGISAGPLDVLIEPGCVFTGDVGSESEFFELAAVLTLAVGVEGLASGNPDEIRAFTVHVEIDD